MSEGSFLEQAQTFFEFVSANIYIQIILAVAIVVFTAVAITPVIIKIIKIITERTKTKLDDEIVEIAKPPIFATLVLCGFVISISIISFPQWFVTTGSQLLKTLGVILWTPAVVRIAKVVFTAVANSPKAKFVNVHTLPLFNNLAIIVIYAVAIYVLFAVWGINMTAWLASAGVVGIAVGFAAKDTLANLISGIFILADRPYKVGDYIVLDSGERGEVTNVGIRSTRILTRGDSEIIIPNSVMGNAKVVNETGGPHKKFRVSVDVGVSYNSDIDKVEKVLLNIAKEDEIVCDDPEPRVRLRTFGDSALDVSLLCWVPEPELRGRAIDSLNRAVYKRFKSENIEIPFPQRDVRITKEQ